MTFSHRAYALPPLRSAVLQFDWSWIQTASRYPEQSMRRSQDNRQTLEEVEVYDTACFADQCVTEQ